MKLAKTPKSKATNAYDLLSDVCKVVLQEPKRVFMNTFMNSFASPNDAAEGGPACGTVGCIAGWVAILKRPNENRPDVRPYGGYDDLANHILGVNESIWGLYGAELYNSRGGEQSYTYGTRAYAQAVVRKIKKFQQKHQASLKAKAV